MALASIHRAFAAGILALAPLVAASPAGAATPAQAGFLPEGRSLFLVYANVVEGQEAEFNRFYDGHMKQIMQVPGFVRSQRLVMTPRPGRPDPAYRYLILYEIDGDPNAVIAALGPAVKEGRLVLPDPKFVAKTESMIYKPVHGGFPGTAKQPR